MHRSIFRTLILSFTLVTISVACEENLLNHSFKRLASDERINLCTEYNDKVVLIVNTASKCGLTRQYEGLERLYQEYADAGLVVLGFPSNDFFGKNQATNKKFRIFAD